MLNMMTLDNQISLMSFDPSSSNAFSVTYPTSKPIPTIDCLTKFVPSFPAMSSFLITRSVFVRRVFLSSHTPHVRCMKTNGGAIRLVASSAAEEPLQTPRTLTQLLPNTVRQKPSLLSGNASTGVGTEPRRNCKAIKTTLAYSTIAVQSEIARAGHAVPPWGNRYIPGL
jgi:hypothetical protein